MSLSPQLEYSQLETQYQNQVNQINANNTQIQEFQNDITNTQSQMQINETNLNNELLALPQFTQQFIANHGALAEFLGSTQPYINVENDQSQINSDQININSTQQSNKELQTSNTQILSLLKNLGQILGISTNPSTGSNLSNTMQQNNNSATQSNNNTNPLSNVSSFISNNLIIIVGGILSTIITGIILNKYSKRKRSK